MEEQKEIDWLNNHVATLEARVAELEQEKLILENQVAILTNEKKAIESICIPHGQCLNCS